MSWIALGPSWWVLRLGNNFNANFQKSSNSPDSAPCRKENVVPIRDCSGGASQGTRSGKEITKWHWAILAAAGFQPAGPAGKRVRSQDWLPHFEQRLCVFWFLAARVFWERTL